MRQLTNEERNWVSQFDRTYKNSRCNPRRYRSDTMNKIRVAGDGSKPPFYDCIDTLMHNTHITDLSKGDLTDMEQVKRPKGPKSNAYTPGDYYALPSLWYSGNWTTMVNNKIDLDRGREDEETDVPGISNKDGTFKVYSFFNSEKVHIGDYSTLERAKAALVHYNKTVTFRGYGVDYT